MIKKLPSHFYCPTEFALEILGGKWKTVIMAYLSVRPWRYAELRRLLPTLSDKVLSERLRELIDKGLVSKLKAQSEKGSVRYTLSARGRSLGTVMHRLYDWGLSNAGAFGVKVDEPLKRLGFRK